MVKPKLSKKLMSSARSLSGYMEAWIIPSGHIQPIEKGDHRRDAYRILKDMGYRRPPIDNWEIIFGEKTGYIRIDTSVDEHEVSIDVISPKVIKRQWRTMKKLDREYPVLYWTIGRTGGKGLEKLRKELRKKGMLEIR